MLRKEKRFYLTLSNDIKIVMDLSKRTQEDESSHNLMQIILYMPSMRDYLSLSHSYTFFILTMRLTHHLQNNLHSNQQHIRFSTFFHFPSPNKFIFVNRTRCFSFSAIEFKIITMISIKKNTRISHVFRRVDNVTNIHANLWPFNISKRRV